MALKRGAPVEVFYRAWADSDGDQSTEWHADTAAARSAADGSLPLRLTAGWVAASVLEDCRSPGGAGHVVIRYADRCWFNAFGEQLETSDPGSLEAAVPAAFVRPPVRPSPRPRLSLLAVRWGGTPETAVDTSTFNWGSTNSTVSSTYSNTLFKVRSTLFAHRAVPPWVPLLNAQCGCVRHESGCRASAWLRLRSHLSFRERRDRSTSSGRLGLRYRWRLFAWWARTGRDVLPVAGRIWRSNKCRRIAAAWRWVRRSAVSARAHAHNGASWRPVSVPAPFYTVR